MKIRSFQPKSGEQVFYRGKWCRITTVLDLTSFIVQPDEDGERPLRALLHELRPVPKPSSDPTDINYPEVDPKMLGTAQERYEIIAPLVDGGSNVSISQRAKECGVGRNTVYRYLEKFKATGMILSLIPNFQSRGAPLKARLPEEVDKIITATIHGFYLKKQKPPLIALRREVIKECRAAGVKPPSASTIRNRVRAISKSLATRAREGLKAANRIRPLRGSMPGVERPWNIILMDHTPLDIILVDRETRQPIGRPTLTIAEDAATRMIVGFCLTYNTPRWMSAGLCLAQAILLKDKWLSRHKIKREWPVWGMPKAIHVDNAREFRGTSIIEAAKELGFSIHNRRAAYPQDGGRVERLIRTINEKIHELPGSTFSNPKQRGEYDSNKEASLTLDELEAYITNWIVGEYHVRPHRGLNGKCPIRVWKDLLLGTESLPGIEIPPVVYDEEFVRLRLLPVARRRVHPYGVDLFCFRYFGDHLRQMLEKAAAETEDAKKEFLIRFDPRDMSRIWILDHFLEPCGEYVELTLLDTSKPAISLYEAKAAKTHERENGNRNPNEETIFATHQTLESVVRDSVAKTKAARKEREKQSRTREEVSRYRPESAKPAAVPPTPVAPTVPVAAQPTVKVRVSPALLAFPKIIN